MGEDIQAKRELFRVKLVNRKTKKTTGYWYLRWVGEGYLLTLWENGRERKDPFTGPDPQLAVDIMVRSMEANLDDFVERYRKAVGALNKAIHENKPLRDGFRPNFHRRTQSQCVNTYKQIVGPYISEALAHLARLPSLGWPAPSREPFARFDGDTPPPAKITR